MKIKCGCEWWGKRQEKRWSWHKWYAWRPVVIEKQCYWLEEVERERGWVHLDEYFEYWNYRVIENENKN